MAPNWVAVARLAEQAQCAGVQIVVSPADITDLVELLARMRRTLKLAAEVLGKQERKEPVDPQHHWRAYRSAALRLDEAAWLDAAKEVERQDG